MRILANRLCQAIIMGTYFLCITLRAYLDQKIKYSPSIRHVKYRCQVLNLVYRKVMKDNIHVVTYSIARTSGINLLILQK